MATITVLAPKPPETSQDMAKQYIYEHESNDEPCKYNDGSPTGKIDCDYNGERACGIGQSLPCSKLRNECDLDNYECQDNWFTRYMQNRYGSWVAAMQFHKQNNWW